jgi:hypothetical protein
LGNAANGDIEHRLSALRYVAITEALPVPQGPVKAADLLAFKDKHAEQLQRCRVRLDGKLADVAAEADDHLRKVKAAEVLQEIRDDVAILQEDMNKKKWPKVLLVGVGGVAAAGLGIAGTVVTGGAALAVGLAVGSGAISAGVAGHKVIELIKMPRYDRHAPFAYAALSARL